MVFNLDTEKYEDIIALVKDASSMDAALNFLRGIGEYTGIDWTEYGL